MHAADCTDAGGVDGETREGRGGGRRRRTAGGAAGAGADATTFRAESEEAFAEADRANSAPPSLGGVFGTLPNLILVQE